MADLMLTARDGMTHLGDGLPRARTGTFWTWCKRAAIATLAHNTTLEPECRNCRRIAAGKRAR